MNPLIKNGCFDKEFVQVGGWIYRKPADWESSTVASGGYGPVISSDCGIWAPAPMPIHLTQYLILQPNNESDFCYVRQPISLEKANYCLTFYAVSRPQYPKGTLVVTIGSDNIFEAELPENWTKFAVDYTSKFKGEVMLSFINRGINHNYAACIASVELNENLQISIEMFEEDEDELYFRRQKLQRKAYKEMYEYELLRKRGLINCLTAMLEEAKNDMEEFEKFKKCLHTGV